MKARGWAQIVVVVVGILLGALFVVAPYSGASELVFYDGAVALAVGTSIVGLRRVWKIRRTPWLLLTIALSLWLGAELLWWSYQARGLDPYPSLADAVFLLAYVPLGLAVAALAKPPGASRDRSAWLDTAVFTLVFGLLVWLFLMEPYATDTSISGLERAVTLAYPVADIFAMGFLVRLLLTRAARSRASLLLGAGVAATLVGDLWFGWLELGTGYEAGTPVDLVWVVGYLLMAVAALDGTAAEDPQFDPAADLRRGRLVAIVVAVLVPQVVMLIALHDLDAPGLGMATVTLVVSTLAVAMIALRMWGLLGVARDIEEQRGRGLLSTLVLSLGRRNQNLIGRQIEALEAMERDEDDPDTLERLFLLDNLATRMRRNAESMLVISGETSPHTLAGAVPLTEVVRIAASEVEGYRRVQRGELGGALVRGDAVSDLAHLLAELLENALAYSPPASPVVVAARRHQAGHTIAIADQGLGMEPSALEEVNRRIETFAADEEIPTTELGLFVVSRLARRHGCRVQLQASPHGGVTAWVLLPHSLLVVDGEAPAAAVAPPTAVPAASAAPPPPPPPPPAAQAPAPTGVPVPVSADALIAGPAIAGSPPPPVAPRDPVPMEPALLAALPATAPTGVQGVGGVANAHETTTANGLRRRDTARSPLPPSPPDPSPGAASDPQHLGSQLRSFQRSVARARAGMDPVRSTPQEPSRP